LADRKVDIVGERREVRDHARWAIGIVQNDVTQLARRQGGKQRREPFDRHHCSVRVVDCGQSFDLFLSPEKDAAVFEIAFNGAGSSLASVRSPREAPDQ
jgi:hypothetical protein